MADFPASTFTPRTTQNLPGITYDPTKTKIGFAEDYSLPAAEIVAIENTLGHNPQGAYATVRAWLDYLSTHSGALPEVVTSALMPVDDVVVESNYCAVLVGLFAIASGTRCEIESGGVLAII
jgi:hypothetical protein